LDPALALLNFPRCGAPHAGVGLLAVVVAGCSDSARG
jgi:hypothetical protein